MTDPAPLTAQQIIDAINAAGSGATQSPGIGLAKDEKPVGIHQRSYRDLRDTVRLSPQTQYGTDVNPHPYQPGDEQAPGGGTQDQILNMQRKLILAGLLDPSHVVAGRWDDKSANAYKVVLAFANRHGMSKDDALTAFMNNPIPTSANSPGSQSAQGITNPADSKDAITSAASSMIGGGLSQSEAGAFAGQQTATEKGAVSAQAAANAAGNPTFTQAPTPGAAAKQYILANNPQDVVNYDTALRTVQFHNALAEL